MVETILFKTALSKAIPIIWENKNHLSLYALTKYGKYKNKDIRFSISYLYRIRIPHTDKYLLVTNRRIPNQLQPVGGVYKRYAESNSTFDLWNYQLDDNNKGLGTDKESDNDLRFRVKGKYVTDVIKWFEKNTEREISHHREFHEELLDTGILPKDEFATPEYKHIKRVYKSLVYSNHHKCYEVLIYDIMELIPNEKQKQELIKLEEKPNDLAYGYAIVSSDDISRMHYTEEGNQIAKVGAHTKLTINQNL